MCVCVCVCVCMCEGGGGYQDGAQRLVTVITITFSASPLSAILNGAGFLFHHPAAVLIMVHHAVTHR